MKTDPEESFEHFRMTSCTDDARLGGWLMLGACVAPRCVCGRRQKKGISWAAERSFVLESRKQAKAEGERCAALFLNRRLDENMNKLIDSKV
jgi:hypothetical protein